jgi:photosystem II stability/assembly factor-like uncharacterized protein
MRRRHALAASAGVALAAIPGAARAQWRPAGLAGAAIQRLLPDPADDGVLYATGVAAGGSAGRTALFKSLDAGRSWLTLERGLPGGFVPTALAVSPDGGRLALVGGTEGLFRSTDAGVTWSAVRGRFPAITALHVDAADPRVVHAGTELNGNFRSQDGGATWRVATRGLTRDRYGVTPGAITFAQHPRVPAQLLMATNGANGVYRSADGGLSWRPATGVPAGAVVALAFAGDADTCFAVQERGVLRSTDAGATWAPVTNGPSGPDLAAIEVEPVGRKDLYVAAARGALFRSTNAGASWVELPALPRPARALAWWGPTTQSALPTLGAAAGEGVQQLALRPTLPASADPGTNRQYFVETGHNVKETFLPFFRARGALERFGPPRTEELTEEGVLGQYFQRARLEYRPEFRGTAYEVQISLLGEQLLGTARPGPIPPFESSADQRYFAETGHSASYAFLRAFTNRGGLDSFGFPISEELQEGGRPVQYFQRARLEYRAELAGRADEVTIGAVGDDLLRRKGWLD